MFLSYWYVINEVSFTSDLNLPHKTFLLILFFHICRVIEPFNKHISKGLRIKSNCGLKDYFVRWKQNITSSYTTFWRNRFLTRFPSNSETTFFTLSLCYFFNNYLQSFCSQIVTIFFRLMIPLQGTLIETKWKGTLRDRIITPQIDRQKSHSLNERFSTSDWQFRNVYFKSAFHMKMK